MSLETYVYAASLVEAGGKHVAVSPLRVRQIPAFTRAISPIMGPLLAGDMLAAVSVGGEDLVRAIAIATGESEEWLGDLLPDEFIQLAAAVVEVNADFFVHRLAPTLSTAGARAMSALTDGATSSPTSSRTATAGQTPSTTP